MTKAPVEPKGAKKPPKKEALPVEVSNTTVNPTYSFGRSANKAYRSAISGDESHTLDISQESLADDDAPEPSSGSRKEGRDEMILECLPLVKYLAFRIAGRVPAHVDVNDLINHGIIGLIEAADRFEPTRNVKFKTFAEQRIRGAILDSLRDMDWVPRTLRRKQKDIEEANHVLSSQLGRAATEEELAQRLGVSLDELHKSLDDLKGMTLGSFEDVGGEGEGLIALIPDPDSEDPHLVLHEAEWREIIKKGIDELPEKECRIVQLYYYEELNMKQIGKILEITESRVSQLHTKAMLHLRRELRSRQIDRR